MNSKPRFNVNKTTAVAILSDDDVTTLNSNPEFITRAAINAGGPFFCFAGHFNENHNVEHPSLKVLKDHIKGAVHHLEVTETPLPQDQGGFVLRTFQLQRNYSYGCPSLYGVVRSDKPEYTTIDNDTLVVAPKTNRYSGSDYWFMVRGYEADAWVLELCHIICNSQDDTERQTWIKNFVQERLEHDLIAHSNLLQELERELNDAELTSLYDFRAIIAGCVAKARTANKVLQFWRNQGNVHRVRCGNWKLERGEGRNAEEFRFTADNGHVKLSTFFRNGKMLPDIENMDEEDLLRAVLILPETPRHKDESRFSSNHLLINDVLIPLGWKHYRPTVFNHCIKVDEIVPLLHAMSCSKAAEDMQNLATDCSTLSLAYRKFLNEGVSVNAKLRIVTEEQNTNKFGDASDIREDYYNGHYTYRNQQGRRFQRTAYKLDTQLRFKVQRRGQRGLSLVYKDQAFPLYPYDLQGKKKKEDIFQRLIRVLKLDEKQGHDEAVKLAKRMVWSAFRETRTAYKKSKELLAATCAELGAEKKRLTIEGKEAMFFVITGTSGAEYAIEDLEGKCRIYRRGVDHIWRFLCIEAASDTKLEVGKDSLVTRLYALANDEDSLEDIHTLKNAIEDARKEAEQQAAKASVDAEADAESEEEEEMEEAISDTDAVSA